MKNGWKTRMFRVCHAVALFLVSGCLAGCSDRNQTQDVLSALERGQAAGELVLTSNGRVGVGQATSFWLGAEQASVSFSGRVNYSGEGTEAQRHGGTEGAVPPAAPATGVRLPGEAVKPTPTQVPSGISTTVVP